MLLRLPNLSYHHDRLGNAAGRCRAVTRPHARSAPTVRRYSRAGRLPHRADYPQGSGCRDRRGTCRYGSVVLYVPPEPCANLNRSMRCPASALIRTASTCQLDVTAQASREGTGRRVRATLFRPAFPARPPGSRSPLRAMLDRRGTAAPAGPRMARKGRIEQRGLPFSVAEPVPRRNSLRGHFRKVPDVVVEGGMFLYYAEGGPTSGSCWGCGSASTWPRT